MFRPGFLAACVLSAGCVVSQPLVKGPIEQAQPEQVVTVSRRRALSALTAPRIRYRGKGKQAKPAKRSNRLHVSRRTRRKHRRAA